MDITDSTPIPSPISLIESIEINPTELCNLQCEFCPRSSGYPNLNYHMSHETIDKTVYEIQRLVNHADLQGVQGSFLNVVITGRGEPSLCKTFRYMLEQFIGLMQRNPKRIKLAVNTNGYRFDWFLDLYQQLTFTRVNLYYNYSYEEYKQFAEKYAQYKNIQVYHRDGTYVELNGKSIPVNYTNRSGAVINEMTNDGPFVDSRCDSPLRKLYVDWNGDYNLCCHDWKTKLALGNIHETGLIEYVLYNEQLNQFRSRLSVGRREAEPCASCNYQILGRKGASGVEKDKIIRMYRRYEKQNRIPLVEIQ